MAAWRVDQEAGVKWLAAYCEAVATEFSITGLEIPDFGTIWRALRPAFPGWTDVSIDAFEVRARERLPLYTQLYQPSDLRFPQLYRVS